MSFFCEFETLGRKNSRLNLGLFAEFALVDRSVFLESVISFSCFMPGITGIIRGLTFIESAGIDFKCLVKEAPT